jgi:hypothetical protein
MLCGLSIPFPMRTLYHFHGPTAQAQQTTQRFANRLPAMLACVPLDQQAHAQTAAAHNLKRDKFNPKIG